MAKTRCVVNGCGRSKEAYRLVCRKHWGLLTADMQKEVWRVYHGGTIEDRRVVAKSIFRYLRNLDEVENEL